MRAKILSALLLAAAVAATPVLADDDDGRWRRFDDGWGRFVVPFLGWDDDWDRDDDWDWDDDRDGWDDGDWNRRWRGSGGYPRGSYYDGRIYVEPGRVSGYVRPYAGAASGYELLELDDRTLRSAVLASTAEFDRWLSGIPAGEVWQTHFETRAILDLASAGVNAPATVEERETILRVLETYDQALRRPDLRTITRMDGFRAAHAALREIAVPADERLVRQLSYSARILHHSLGGFSTGAAWQRYLTLPDEIVAAADRPPAAAERDRQFDAEELQAILDRYDRVSRNVEFRPIAALPAFQATHDRLAELVSRQDASRAAPPAAPPSPPAEDLPPPRP